MESQARPKVELQAPPLRAAAELEVELQAQRKV